MKSIRTSILTPGLFAALLIASPVFGAHNAYLALTSNGAAVEGEPTIVTIGGVSVQDQIECIAFNHEVFVGDGARRIHGPIKIVKRVDKSSPLLYKAFGQNEVLSGTFRFFRKNADTGLFEHFHTIQISGGRLAGVRHWFPNTADPASIDYPQMEEVSFTYQTITITNEITQTQTELTWSTP